MANDQAKVIITKPDDLKKAMREIVHTILAELRDEYGLSIRNDKTVLSPRQIEKIYGITKNLLRYWRNLGVGPTFTHQGRRVFYNQNEFEEFLNSGRIQTLPLMGDE